MKVGLYRTSRLVQKSSNFSESRLSGNWMFSFPGLWTWTFKNRKKIKFLFFKVFFSRFFFVYLFGPRTFDTKFVSRDLILWAALLFPSIPFHFILVFSKNRRVEGNSNFEITISFHFSISFRNCYFLPFWLLFPSILQNYYFLPFFY